jgi:hypothetical protein
MFVIAELVDGEKYAAASESEVICDLGSGKKSQRSASVGFRFQGLLKQAHAPPPVTSSATGAALAALRLVPCARAARQYCSLDFVFEADVLVKPSA